MTKQQRQANILIEIQAIKGNLEILRDRAYGKAASLKNGNLIELASSIRVAIDEAADQARKVAADV